VRDVPDTIATERLLLRRPTLADAPAVFEYGSDPEVTGWMPWPTHRGLDTVVEFLASCPHAWKSGAEHTWIMTERPDDRAIGSISFRPRGHSVDLGYVLNRRRWGRGLATEALRAVVGWLFTRDEVHRVWATCDVDNPRSARVLEKAGLSREAVLRAWGVRPNVSTEPRDMFMYAKVRAEA
jgi:RimJ/RimL family protein N-acetyltransferase